MESDVRCYSRMFPATFTTARGSLLTDKNGREYLDFFCGAGSLNYGHNEPGMKQALIDYLADDGLVQSLDLHTAAKAAFLEVLESTILHPRQLDYKVQFAGPSGSNGIEAALKLARLVKKRGNVIAFSNSFHGLSLGALAVTGNAFFRNEAFVDRHNVSFLPFDGYLGPGVNTIDYLKKALGDPGSGVDLPAAILVETIQAEGGINVAATDWLRELGRLCREHDILLIVDDIQTGVGRTGSFFSFEEAGLYPDLVVLSKSLSGFGLPMSLLLLKPELDQWRPGEHTGTFRGNNLAFITATEALRHFWRDDALSAGIGRRAGIIAERLRDITARYPEITVAARGRGMLHGLRMKGKQETGAVINTCFQQGLLVESCGAGADVVKIIPPLTIAEDLLKKGLDILEQGIAAVRAQGR
jgi:diaminobutyrate-2-oxoglutarate transaminase